MNEWTLEVLCSLNFKWRFVTFKLRSLRGKAFQSVFIDLKTSLTITVSQPSSETHKKREKRRSSFSFSNTKWERNINQYFDTTYLVTFDLWLWFHIINARRKENCFSFGPKYKLMIETQTAEEGKYETLIIERRNETSGNGSGKMYSSDKRMKVNCRDVYRDVVTEALTSLRQFASFNN